MTHVAFFRGMNLGQARSKSPTSAVLVDAFLAAGAHRAENFQTNGTVAFATSGVDQVIPELQGMLLAAAGYSDTVVVREASWVIELGRRLDPALPGGEVALFDALSVPDIQLPWVDPRGKLAVRELDRLHAVTAWAASGPDSSSNPVLTRMLAVPVTCRGLPTMVRLGLRLSAD